MKKESNKNKYFLKGFTIIESLVAVSVLMIAVTGPLALAARGLSYSQYAKDQITAFYLASEAIEAVKNIRDANMIDPQDDGNGNKKDWLGRALNGSGGFSKCDNINNPCYFDVWKNPPDVRTSWDEINYPQTGQPSPTDFTVFERTSGNKKFFGWKFDRAPNGDGDDQPTIFSRRIITQPLGVSGSEEEVRVTVIVDWFARNGILREVVLTTNLFKLY